MVENIFLQGDKIFDNPYLSGVTRTQKSSVRKSGTPYISPKTA